MVPSVTYSSGDLLELIEQAESYQLKEKSAVSLRVGLRKAALRADGVLVHVGRNQFALRGTVAAPPEPLRPKTWVSCAVEVMYPGQRYSLPGLLAKITQRGLRPVSAGPLGQLKKMAYADARHAGRIERLGDGMFCLRGTVDIAPVLSAVEAAVAVLRPGDRCDLAEIADRVHRQHLRTTAANLLSHLRHVLPGEAARPDAPIRVAGRGANGRFLFSLREGPRLPSWAEAAERVMGPGRTYRAKELADLIGGSGARPVDTRSAARISAALGRLATSDAPKVVRAGPGLFALAGTVKPTPVVVRWADAAVAVMVPGGEYSPRALVALIDDSRVRPITPGAPNRVRYALNSDASRPTARVERIGFDVYRLRATAAEATLPRGPSIPGYDADAGLVPMFRAVATVPNLVRILRRWAPDRAPRTTSGAVVHVDGPTADAQTGHRLALLLGFYSANASVGRETIKRDVELLLEALPYRGRRPASSQRLRSLVGTGLRYLPQAPWVLIAAEVAFAGGRIDQAWEHPNGEVLIVEIKVGSHPKQLSSAKTIHQVTNHLRYGCERWRELFVGVSLLAVANRPASRFFLPDGTCDLLTETPYWFGERPGETIRPLFA